MRVATGSYVSDGNSRDVAVAFQPVLVLFQQASGATHYTTLKLSVMSGSNGVDLLNTSRSLASGVCTLTSSGFTVGTSSLRTQAERPISGLRLAPMQRGWQLVRSPRITATIKISTACLSSQILSGPWLPLLGP